MPQFGTLWRQLHTKLGPPETQHWEHCSTQASSREKNMERTSEYPCFNVFVMGRPCAPILSACGLKLGAKLLPGPSCGMLEPSWAEIGAKWAQVGPKLLLCRIEMAHLDEMRTILLVSILKMHPHLPAEAVPDWQIGPFASLAAQIFQIKLPCGCYFPASHVWLWRIIRSHFLLVSFWWTATVLSNQSPALGWANVCTLRCHQPWLGNPWTTWAFM